MKNFFRTLGRNARRIALGIIGISCSLGAIYIIGMIMTKVGYALTTAMVFVGELCRDYLWVAILIMAILGYTGVELIESSEKKHRKRRNRQ